MLWIKQHMHLYDKMEIHASLPFTKIICRFNLHMLTMPMNWASYLTRVVQISIAINRLTVHCDQDSNIHTQWSLTHRCWYSTVQYKKIYKHKRLLPLNSKLLHKKISHPSWHGGTFLLSVSGKTNRLLPNDEYRVGKNSTANCIHAREKR